jgi:hypothetical protein
MISVRFEGRVLIASGISQEIQPTVLCMGIGWIKTSVASRCPVPVLAENALKYNGLKRRQTLHFYLNQERTTAHAKATRSSDIAEV